MNYNLWIYYKRIIYCTFNIIESVLFLDNTIISFKYLFSRGHVHQSEQKHIANGSKINTNQIHFIYRIILNVRLITVWKLN